MKVQGFGPLFLDDGHALPVGWPFGPSYIAREQASAYGVGASAKSMRSRRCWDSFIWGLRKVITSLAVPPRCDGSFVP